VREMILERWPCVINGSKFIFPDARLVSFMNHSFSVNYDPLTDTALKDIKAGEEILEDYTKMPNWEEIWPPEKNPWLIASNVIE
ncbi:MAG: SET domain-containing protein, partial [Nanoarchaeota archaeon]